MATLINTGSGNFNNPSTWATVDATSFLDSRATSTTLTTTPVASTTFIPGAITVQGVAVQLAGRSATPTGTMTVQLFNSTTSANVSSSVINVADLPNTAGIGANNLGWTYFKFAIPQNLTAGQSYSIRLSTSAINQVSCYSLATSNWSRALVTTTTATPAATDTILITGEYISAGVSNDRTVTMDNSGSITYYGNMYVGAKGKLTYGTNASTNYTLGIAGDLYVTYSGSLEIGTLASPILSSSTARLEISASSIGQRNIFLQGCNYTTYGTSSISAIGAKLTANVAVAATSSTTDVSTGWRSGDLIGASATNSLGGFETIALLANASTTTLPSHSAYVNARSGSVATLEQADLVNLTRNIVITSTIPANRTTIQVSNNTNVSSSWTAYQNIGTTTVAGIAMANISAGSFYFQYNSLYQSASAVAGAGMSMGSTVNRNVSNNIFYNLATTGYTGAVLGSIDDGNYVIGATAFQSFNGTIRSNNTLANHTSHCAAGVASGSTGNNIYQCGTGIYYTNAGGINGMDNSRVWRCGIGILSVQTFGVTRATIMTFNNLYMFGNTTNVALGSSATAMAYKTVFSSSRFWGGSTVVTAAGIDAGSQLIGQSDTIYYNNCIFGKNHLDQTSSFSLACVRNNPGANVNLFNCIFTGTENILNITNNNFLPTNTTMGFISFNHNQVVGSYRIFTKSSTLQTDTTYFTSSPESLRITPLTTTIKSITPNIRIPVKSGNTCTVSVKVRKSASPDAVYNGAQPRLMYVFNPVAGNFAETTGATATAASNGAWETLTYTTPAVSNDCVLEFYVDCDGSTGFLNVDDWSTTSYNDSRGFDFCGPVGTYVEAGYRTPGGNYTFVS
jgi:hypothetical protein